jgi:hypothetical protein
VKVSKIERNDVYVGKAIKFKCDVECANPKVYTYRWIVNNKEDENIMSSKEAFPQNDSFEYSCNDTNSFVILCCVSNGVGDEKCGETNLNCIRKLNIFVTLIFIPFFKIFHFNFKPQQQVLIFFSFKLLTTIH